MMRGETVRRDFSDASKKDILAAIGDIEKEDSKPFSKWQGNNSASKKWITKIEIGSHLKAPEKYLSLKNTKNKDAKKKITAVYKKANTLDKTCKSQLHNQLNSLKSCDSYITKLAMIINPSFDNFKSDYISKIMRTEVLTVKYNKLYRFLNEEERVELKEVLDLISGTEGILEQYLPTDLAIVLEKIDEKTNATDAISLASGLLGYIKAQIKLKNPEYNATPLERVQNLLGVDSSLLSIYSSLLQLNNESDMAGYTGIVGNGVKTVSKLLNASNRSIEEQLKESGELSVAGVSLAKALWKISPEGKLEKFLTRDCSNAELKKIKLEQLGETAAAASAVTMISRALGDIIEKSRDGNYNVSDYGDTLLDTGMVGMNSLISSLTCGTINIDNNRSKSIFDANIEMGQKFINDTCGDSVVGKVVLTPFVVVDVAVMGISETIIDKGMEIGGNIRKFFGFNGNENTDHGQGAGGGIGFR